MKTLLLAGLLAFLCACGPAPQGPDPIEKQIEADTRTIEKNHQMITHYTDATIAELACTDELLDQTYNPKRRKEGVGPKCKAACQAKKDLKAWLTTNAPEQLKDNPELLECAKYEDPKPGEVYDELNKVEEGAWPMVPSTTTGQPLPSQAGTIIFDASKMKCKNDPKKKMTVCVINGHEWDLPPKAGSCETAGLVTGGDGFCVPLMDYGEVE